MSPAALIGVLALGWLTLFQIMLAAGLPLGRMAWGGAHRTLPSRLRLASLASAVLTAFGAVVVAQAGGVVQALPTGTVIPALWSLVGLFTVSFLANLLGASGIERLHGVPVTLCCCGSALWLAVA